MSEQRTTEPVVSDMQLPGGNCQSGTARGYQVQARFMSDHAKHFGDVVLDQRWQTLHFSKVPPPFGVPTANRFDWYLPAACCMRFEAAQALRWWFLANCATEFGGALCVETRIIEFEIKYSHDAKAEGVLEEAKDAWRDRPL